MIKGKLIFYLKSFLLILSLSFVVCGCAAKTQTQVSKVFHVGILSGVENFSATIDSFKTDMTKLGYVENKNIIYDIRRINGEPDKEKAISEEFVKNKVDLIFTFPNEAALAAKIAAANAGIPVVFSWVTIEATKLVDSISHPGGNITGVRHSTNDLLAKTYDILLEMSPNIKRVWMIYDPNIPSAVDFMNVIRPIAQAAGVAIVETAEVTSIDDLKKDLAARSKKSDIGVDAIMLLPGAIGISPEGIAIVSEFAKEQKIPLAGLSSAQVGSGVLFGFGPTTENESKLSAFQADKVLKGAKAGDLPVVTADGSLWIDYRVAQEIGLKIPEGVLSRAEKILR
jgi:putative tryptophan/tyrosine transport system substrate-binding protein